jgi:hypothetical protein
VQLPPDDYVHLTYCTNIHAADGWPAVDANLRRFAPALKARLSPGAPFGLGLRLSARDVRELQHGHVEAFRAWLDQQGLYVALINGFPYGAFHRASVKADVYAPDWRDEDRVRYTASLIDVLAALVPAGVDGGVSTAPLSYKRWMPAGDEDGWAHATRNVVRIAEQLIRLQRERGIAIHLDIEPEPDCCLETTDEAIEFFDRWLLPIGVPVIATAFNLSEGDARAALIDRIRICVDCCHAAVEFEDPLVAIARLRTAGIEIGRVQLSSALRLTVPEDPAAAAPILDRLRPFADSTYLHQVIQRRPDGSLGHVADLGDAIASPVPGEWRVHFHVPLFAADYEGLGSTQEDVRRVIGALRTGRFTRHLEIETYTWDVLPGALKIDLLESIVREYQWVLACTKPSFSTSSD